MRKFSYKCTFLVGEGRLSTLLELIDHRVSWSFLILSSTKLSLTSNDDELCVRKWCHSVPETNDSALFLPIFCYDVNSWLKCHMASKLSSTTAWYIMSSVLTTLLLDIKWDVCYGLHQWRYNSNTVRMLGVLVCKGKVATIVHLSIR